MNDQNTPAVEADEQKSWFSLIFDEYHERGEAMFAFSQRQVEEQGVTWDEFQKGWSSVGAGLHVKTTVLTQFVDRMNAGHAGHLASLPELRVKHVGSDFWSRGMYEVVDDDVKGKGVRKGQMLCDVSLAPPNEATELHRMTSEDEPIDTVKVRPVFVLEDGTERKAG